MARAKAVPPDTAAPAVTPQSATQSATQAAPLPQPPAGQVGTPRPALRKDPLDIKAMSMLAGMTSSLSPLSLLLAATDWAGHLSFSPGRRLKLLELAIAQARDFSAYALGHPPAFPVPPPQSDNIPLQEDRRFAGEAWQVWPYNLLVKQFQLAESWWQTATEAVPGVERHHGQVVAFCARQMLDLFSPGNHLLTNPIVLQRTLASGGTNLLRGSLNALEDFERSATGHPPAGTDTWQPGQAVAVTPGKVVVRNRLMELIQYAPAPGVPVHPEPVLIVPAWIMKYYILDLSPHNSLIRYLTEQGHTVFCISWKNPGEEDAALGMDDYLELGMEAALAAIGDILPGAPIHAAGYCLGGTLLTIAAAALARDGRDRLASVTLFAAQTDFTEPGELALFIDESQVSMLEAQMRDVGYLSAGQMAGAFQLLRSNDLIWSRLINEYLLGERAPMNDLMAWNADATRMPARMHAQYLRRLFLNNDLAAGRYPVGGRPVSVGDIRVPMFCVATVTDHVAPWRSVYKIHHLTATEVSFVLTNGGHNAGIVSEPGRRNRHFQQWTRPAGGHYVAPEDWLAHAPRQEGSWWPAWSQWLKAHSSAPGAAPALGSAAYPPVGEAPGTYVFGK